MMPMRAVDENTDQVDEQVSGGLITNKKVKSLMFLIITNNNRDVDGDFITIQGHTIFVDVMHDVVVDINPELPLGDRVFEWTQVRSESPNNYPLLVVADNEDGARALIDKEWLDEEGCGILKELKEEISFKRGNFRIIA